MDDRSALGRYYGGGKLVQREREEVPLGKMWGVEIGDRSGGVGWGGEDSEHNWNR